MKTGRLICDVLYDHIYGIYMDMYIYKKNQEHLLEIWKKEKT